MEAEGTGGAETVWMISDAPFHVNYSYDQSFRAVYYLLIIIIIIIFFT